MMKDNEWKPVENFRLETNALEAIRNEKNLLVIAGPGAGKTEMLAQKANYLFETGTCSDPYNILAISFKTDSASNLAERVNQRSPELASHRFDSMTYDALAKRILDQFRNGLDPVNRPNSDYLVQEELNLRKMVRLSLNSNSMSNRNANRLWKRFSFLKQKVSDSQRLLGQMMLHGTNELQANLSYHGIMQLAIRIVKSNPHIRKAFQAAYPFVFLDEFQDTTDLQYQFIKTLFESSTVAITAVGDDKQRIMDFAGARKTIFLDFVNDFGAERLRLYENHRSAPKLINLQMQMYQSLQAHADKIIPSPNWNENDGEISLIQSVDENDEARIIAQNIMEHVRQGIKPNEMVVLVKQYDRTYALPIIKALKELGIKSRVESEYQSLLKEPVVQVILQSVIFSSTVGAAEKWQNFFDLYLESQGITDVEDEEILYKSEMRLNEFLKSLGLRLKSDSTSALVQNIVDFWTKEFFQASFSGYLQGSSLDDTINDFIRLMDLERQSVGTWIDAVNSFMGENSVPIMTIHKSKGLEFKVVYLIALDDNAFWSFKNDPDATRRALFVAISRAKQYLIFTFAQNRSNINYPGPQKHTEISEFYDLISPFVE